MISYWMNIIIYIDLLTNMLSFDEYIEKNYDIIRSEYEEILSDQEYYWDLSEVNDWWREYQEQDYAIYLSNLKRW